ncbi:hypothetical protein MNBD_GAMMA23-2374 [hydrothermal vent metagenome]|uniref:Uncharacterized protein n=1 Tax=hydrothermal vent metagenome TaxID=652676 RepID=A0A3B1B1Z3_9ZZZZ
MLEYELSVNVKVENKEALQNLLITVESINASSLDASSVELLSISRLNTSNAKQKHITKNYEQDSWLSPLTVKAVNTI